MASFKMTMDENLKGKLEKRAKELGKSLSELINDYIQIGKAIDLNTTPESIVIIEKSKVVPNDKLLVPIQELLRG